MIDALTLTNVYVPGALTLNDLNYPVDQFTTEVDMSAPDRKKGRRHGNFTTPTIMGTRGLHISGQICGSGATDALLYADYVTKRRDLIRRVLPKNERFYDESCILDILFTGMSEHVTAACTIDGYPEIPMSWDTGARSPFQLNLKAFDPRLYGITNNTVTLPHNVPTVVTNLGDIEVYPTVSISGGSSGVSSRQFRWGAASADYRYVTYGATVTAGHIASIDFDKLSAINETGASVLSSLTARDWWALEPGDNIITYIGAGGTPAGTSVTISWHNAYML